MPNIKSVKNLETTVDRKITTVEQLTEHVESIRLNIHAEEIYKNIKEEFESYIETENYKSILRVYNQKGDVTTEPPMRDLRYQ